MKIKQLDVVSWVVRPISGGRFAIDISASRISGEGEVKYFTVELTPPVVKEIVAEVMAQALDTSSPETKPEPSFTLAPKAKKEVIDPDTGLIDHFPQGKETDPGFAQLIENLGIEDEKLDEKIPGVLLNDDAGPDGDKMDSAQFAEIGKMWASGYLDTRPRSRAELLTKLSGQNTAWLVRHKALLPKALRYELVDILSSDNRNIVGPAGQGRNFTTMTAAALLDDDDAPPNIMDIIKGRIN